MEKLDAAVHGRGGAHMDPLQEPWGRYCEELRSPAPSEAAGRKTISEKCEERERDGWLAGWR